MRERVVRFLEPLLLPLVRALLPARGRHRATVLHQLAVMEEPLARAHADRFHYDTPLVRPYLLTPPERHERKLQRQRRRALWLATYGIDAGPRRIHGMEVPT